MGWVKDFFKPGPYEISPNKPGTRTAEEVIQDAIGRGDPAYAAWKYVRDMPFHTGHVGFYDWVLGIRKAVKAGEIDREYIIDFLGLGETNG